MSQAGDTASDPDDLTAWGLHCYCPGARQTPHGVVAEADNGKVLYAARRGASREQLGLGSDQLARLLEFGLLEWRDAHLRTAFPVIGSQVMTAMRRRLRELAGDLAATGDEPARLTEAELTRQGFGHSGYALIFGYALDLLLWEPLVRTGAVPSTALTPDRPWWNGAFWAIYPPRNESSGTNFVHCGDNLTLVLVWSDETTQQLSELAADPRFRQSLRRVDPVLPLVGDGGSLDQLAHRLAAPVTGALLGEDTAAARDLVPTDDPGVATVVVAHELIWEVAEHLVARGACRAPAASDEVTGRMFLLTSYRRQ